MDIVSSSIDLGAAREVVTRYARLADDGSIDEIVELFASDGVWQAGPTVFKGREEIRAGIQGMRDARHAGPASGTRHFVMNELVEQTGQDTAEVTCYWLLVSSIEQSILHSGKFRESLRKDGHCWLIIEHSVEGFAP